MILLPLNFFLQAIAAASCTCKDEVSLLAKTIATTVASLENSLASISSKVDCLYSEVKHSKVSKLGMCTPSSSQSSSVQSLDTETLVKEDVSTNSKYISVSI